MRKDPALHKVLDGSPVRLSVGKPTRPAPSMGWRQTMNLMPLYSFDRQQWLANPRRDLLVGTVVALAQIPELFGTNRQTYAVVVAALVTIYRFPRITKAVPSPLVAIVVISVFVILTGTLVRTVSDMGQMPTVLPLFHLPPLVTVVDIDAGTACEATVTWSRGQEAGLKCRAWPISLRGLVAARLTSAREAWAREAWPRAGGW